MSDQNLVASLIASIRSVEPSISQAEIARRFGCSSQRLGRAVERGAKIATVGGWIERWNAGPSLLKLRLVPARIERIG